MSSPVRMCIGCHQRRPKPELIKIVLSALGEIEIDLTQKVQRRGAYICSNDDCLKAAVNFKRLNRAFRHTVSSEAMAQFKSKLLELQVQAKRAN